jgi:hypothetical protein
MFKADISQVDTAAWVVALSQGSFSEQRVSLLKTKKS